MVLLAALRASRAPPLILLFYPELSPSPDLFVPSLTFIHPSPPHLPRTPLPSNAPSLIPLSVFVSIFIAPRAAPSTFSFSCSVSLSVEKEGLCVR